MRIYARTSKLIPWSLTMWLIVAMLSHAALAQERARDFIEPRITKVQFQQFVQKVGLQSEQKQIMTIAFADYEATLNDLALRLDDQALAAGRQRVDESLSGKARIAADELMRLRGEVLRVYLQAGPEADLALEMLITSVEVLLTNDQLLKFDAARKWLHRETLLHPRANASTYQEYAGDGVDVLLLVDDARSDGGELAGLAPDALNAILNAYEDQLDQVLIDTASANRQGTALRKIATIEKDIDAFRREEAAALQRWQRLYDLNTQTVNKVAAVAQAALGAPAAEAFKRRYERESFAWMYPRKKPDRQIEWIRQQATISPETLAAAEQAYAEYAVKRDSLSRSAITMMLRARTEFQTFLYTMMDNTSVDERIKGNLYLELMKNSGEQSLLESTTASLIEATLDDEARSELRNAMKRPDRTARPTASSSR